MAKAKKKNKGGGRRGGKGSAGRKGGRRRTGTGPRPAGPSSNGRDPSQRDDSTGSLRRLLEKGKHDQLLAQLERRWPSSEHRPARLAWLLLHWPERALTEIAQEPPQPSQEPQDAVTIAISGCVPSLAPETIEALAPYMPEPWLAQAREVRAASEQIAAGEDDAALQRLRAIGLRSPFRDARAFLRGLAAYYRGDDAEARRALGLVRAGVPLATAAARILAALPKEESAEPAPPDAPVHEDGRAEASRGGGGPGAAPDGAARDDALRRLGRADLAAVERIAELIRTGRANLALREASKRHAELAPHVRQALARDLPGALLCHFGPRPAWRLLSAVPAPADDPSRHRHKALLAEHQPEEHEDDATRHWQAYGRQLDRLAVYDGPARTSAKAAVYMHLGRSLLTEAKEDAHAAPPLAAIFGGEATRQAHEMRQQAIAHLETAVEADPEAEGAWQSLAEAYRAQGEDRAYRRTVERMVGALPHSPDALKLAAAAAGARQAWDKGYRYVQRAARLEPLDREAGDLASQMRRGKARKHFAKGELDEAHAIYAEVREATNLTAQGARIALAEVAAFFDSVGEVEAAAALRDETVAQYGQPWMWLGHFRLAQSRLYPAGGRPAANRPPYRGALDPNAVRSEPPEPDELAAMVELAQSFDDKTWERVPGLLGWIDEGLRRGADRLSDLRTIRAALDLPCSPGTQLALAEAGTRLEPPDWMLVIQRYVIALESGQPPAYFEHAIDDLESAREHLTGERGPPPPFVSMALDELTRAIAEYTDSNDDAGGIDEDVCPDCGRPRDEHFAFSSSGEASRNDKGNRQRWLPF